MNTETNTIHSTTQQTLHIMIDIETGGLVPGSSIFSIGAVAFALTLPEHMCRLLPDDMETTFYARINRKSCEQRGLIEYAETMEWWEAQDEDIRIEAFTGEAPISIALSQLSTFISSFRGKGYKIDLWCKQNNFDFSLLEAAYKKCEQVVPWTFRELRDCRTVFQLFTDCESLMPVHLNKHNALSDAAYQALCMNFILEQLADAALLPDFQFLIPWDIEAEVECEDEEGDNNGE